MKNKFPRLPLRFAWLWVLVFVALVLAAPSAFRKVKSWRAQIYLTQAKEALIKGDLNLASEKGKLSLQLDPSLVDAVRVLARIADLNKEPSRLSYWVHIVQSGYATDSDRLALGEAALQENALPLVGEQLNILLSRSAPVKETYNLAGLFEIRRQRSSLAREWFLKALSLDSQYARAEVNLARTEIFFADRKETEERGLDRLRVLGSRKNELGLESLRILAEYGKDHSARLPYDQKLADSLRHHPLVKMQERCLAADWEIQTYPDRQDALVNSLTSSIPQLSPQAKCDLARWLNRHKLFEKTLSLFPLDPETPEDLLLIQLDALAALGRWQQISDFLFKSTIRIQPLLRSLFQARATLELGQKKSFNLNWQQALRQAEKNPQALHYLADYADKIGKTTYSIEVYETLSQTPNYQLEALLKLVGLYGRLGKTRDLLRTIQRLSIIYPNDTAITSDLAYLGLLLNESSVQPFERAGQVYASDPRLPAFAVTYALAQLKSSKPAAALKALDPFALSDLKAPGWQAIYAAVLLANEHRTDALKIVEKIDRKKLKPEEEALIAPLLLSK